MNHLLRHTTVFLALLTLLLTACGRSAPTHFYLLDSGQPPLTADSLPAASLSIAPVSVPDYLDRNGLVRRSDGQTRLEVSELDIWAEPLGQGARRVLGEVLATRLLPRGIDVIAAGDRQGDMELAVALERLDGDTPGTARLQARWQLSRGGEALDRGIYAASEDAGMSSASLVAAQSRLLQGLGGRRRLLPDINSASGQAAALARRQAINTVIQGSAADIIKLAMLAVARDERLRELDARLLLQVHDELLLEVPADAAEEAGALVARLMQDVCPAGKELSVPLLVDWGTGHDWGAAH